MTSAPLRETNGRLTGPNRPGCALPYVGKKHNRGEALHETPFDPPVHRDRRDPPLLAADPITESGATSPGLNAVTFCEGRYALCVKAPCRPVVSRAKDGTYSISEADCVCDVLSGWSMGPGDCDSRKPVKLDGHTYLVSTYSNFYNTTNLTLTCSSENTVWAWCFGQPCVIDEKDPTKAMCTCPVKTGKALTLGGGCRESSCKSIWSATTPANDAFANDYFYKYMTDHHLKPAPNPPAKACPAPPAKTSK